MTRRRIAAALILAATVALGGCADWNWRGTMAGWLRQTCCNSDRCSGPPNCAGRG